MTLASLRPDPRPTFSLIHLTDPHMPPDDEPLVRGVDTATRFVATINSINALVPRPECVILTGDLSVAGAVHGASRALDLIRQLRVPVHLTFGNHDHPQMLRRLIGEGGAERLGKRCQSWDLHGWRIVVLDSCDWGDKGGSLGEEQRSMLRAELTKSPRLPALLFLHHHVLPLGLPWVDPDNLHDWREFLEILREAATVRAVFSGHAHQASEEEWNGIRFFVTPSAAYQFYRDPTGPRISADPPAFRVIHVGADTFSTAVCPVAVEEAATGPCSAQL